MRVFFRNKISPGQACPRAAGAPDALAGDLPATAREMMIMSATDKIKNTVEDAKGKTKEAAGEATDNRRLKTEGKADQIKSDLKQAGEKVKDAGKH
jgi:uncharacterized protein YjbJ (UPF0337 family)